MVPGDQNIQLLIDTIREQINKQEDLNKEVKRLAVTVFGDQAADINGLVGDNKLNKAYIENDRKWKWTIAGASITIGFVLKETWHKIFG